MGKVIRIKNMVCPRCLKVVEDEIGKLGYKVKVKRLGEIEILDDDKNIDLIQIEETLLRFGFELLIDKQHKIVEDIKTTIINLVYSDDLEEMQLVLSKYLAEKLNHDYSYLSTLFSSVEHITIEKYFIQLKVERTKELLIYNDYTLSVISYILGYSSVQYLSNQFKNITGMTPSQFKKASRRNRQSVEYAQSGYIHSVKEKNYG